MPRDKHNDRDADGTI